jgi:hypothetical protein
MVALLVSSASGSSPSRSTRSAAAQPTSKSRPSAANFPLHDCSLFSTCSTTSTTPSARCSPSRSVDASRSSAGVAAKARQTHSARIGSGRGSNSSVFSTDDDTATRSPSSAAEGFAARSTRRSRQGQLGRAFSRAPRGSGTVFPAHAAAEAQAHFSTRYDTTLDSTSSTNLPPEAVTCAGPGGGLSVAGSRVGPPARYGSRVMHRGGASFPVSGCQAKSSTPDDSMGADGALRYMGPVLDGGFLDLPEETFSYIYGVLEAARGQPLFEGPAATASLGSPLSPDAAAYTPRPQHTPGSEPLQPASSRSSVPPSSTPFQSYVPYDPPPVPSSPFPPGLGHGTEAVGAMLPESSLVGACVSIVTVLQQTLANQLPSALGLVQSLQQVLGVMARSPTASLLAPIGGGTSGGVSVCSDYFSVVGSVDGSVTGSSPGTGAGGDTRPGACARVDCPDPRDGERPQAPLTSRLTARGGGGTSAAG